MHKITPETKTMVYTLASEGCTQPGIAAALGVSVDTLARRYRSELDTGTSVAVSRVSKRLFQIAMGEGRDAVTAAIFIMKCRANWSQSPEVQVNVTNQAVSTPQAVAKLSPANEEALAALIASARDRVRLPS
jgi:hypothetical protein